MKMTITACPFPLGVNNNNEQCIDLEEGGYELSCVDGYERGGHMGPCIGLQWLITTNSYVCTVFCRY